MDGEFSQFKASLDAEMKRLQSSGKGVQKHQAEPLTPEEEDVLWEKGLLGDESLFVYNAILQWIP